jgi:hypothetical protein
MSKINWIKASLHGKLGEIVGSSWRGTPYIKVYTKPTNPNTPEQQKTRITFTNLAHIGNALKEPLLLYARPATPKMTAANRIMSLNKHMFGKTGTGWDPMSVVIMTGDLPVPPLFEGYINHFNNQVLIDLAWDEELKAPTVDGFLAILLDNETKKMLYTVDTDPDLSQNSIFDVTSWAATSSLTDVYGYLAFFKINEDGSGTNSITLTTKCRQISKASTSDTAGAAPEVPETPTAPSPAPEA